MMMNIVQGDSFNLTITVESGSELIEELWFSCKKLDLCKQCTKVDDTTYIITLNTQETCNCTDYYTTYDITAKLKDNQINTVIYNGQLRVLKKENVINGN